MTRPSFRRHANLQGRGIKAGHEPASGRLMPPAVRALVMHLASAHNGMQESLHTQQPSLHSQQITHALRPLLIQECNSVHCIASPPAKAWRQIVRPDRMQPFAGVQTHDSTSTSALGRGPGEDSREAALSVITAPTVCVAALDSICTPFTVCQAMPMQECAGEQDAVGEDERTGHDHMVGSAAGRRAAADL